MMSRWLVTLRVTLGLEAMVEKRVRGRMWSLI